LKMVSAAPIEKDAMDGPASIEVLARVAAQLSESDRAIAAVEKLLNTGERSAGYGPATHSCTAPARFGLRSAPE